MCNIAPPPASPGGAKDAVELVLSGLQESKNYCTETEAGSRVVYESCLLLQGSLGWWVRGCVPNSHCNSAQITSLIESKDYESLLDLAFADGEFHGLLALAITNNVPILSNTLNYYFYLSFEPDFIKPGIDPELCLMVRHGICGNQVAVATAIAQQVGITARDIDFYWSEGEKRQSHTMMEVEIDGNYVLYDVTFGGFWPNAPDSAISRTLEAITSSGAAPVMNQSLFPQAYLDPHYHQFLSANPSVIRGGVGIVHHDYADSSERFNQRPNYVGWNSPRAHPEASGIQHSFEIPANASTLSVHSDTVIGKKVKICLSSAGCVAVSSGEILFFDLAPYEGRRVQISVESPDPTAYVTLSEVAFH